MVGACRRDDFVHWTADHLRAGVAIHAFGSAIRTRDEALEASAQNGVSGRPTIAASSARTTASFGGDRVDRSAAAVLRTDCRRLWRCKLHALTFLTLCRRIPARFRNRSRAAQTCYVASSISSGCRRIRLVSVGSSLIWIAPHAAATQNARVIMPRTYGSRAFGLRRGTPKRQAGCGTHPGRARRAGRPQRARYSRSGTRRAAIPSSRNTPSTARRIVRTK